MKKTIKVVELFAGVGGFRLGLEGWKGKSPSSQYKLPLQSPYKIIWSNQWEPATKTQHASLVYEKNWGNSGHINQDITTVCCHSIPNHDLLVAGFPCQDYSVATTLKNAKGLIGKKGVLWWSIHKILSEIKKKPSFLVLENVDRLLISPGKQRGRDLAIILKSLNELGYAVEWRVINAAEYGMPQRRRRVFLIGYHQSSSIFPQLRQIDYMKWLIKDGILANAFPINYSTENQINTFTLDDSLIEISDHFNSKSEKGVFKNTGLMVNGVITTVKTSPNYLGKMSWLNDFIQKKSVPAEFYIPPTDLKRWKYLKGAKSELRKKSTGFEYYYKEGKMAFPDPLDRPSRTIITGEGGKGPSRFKHVIQTKKGLRRLTPVELERLNMFPDKFTQLEGVSDTKRAFLMGNSLVVGVVEKIGQALSKRITGS